MPSLGIYTRGFVNSQEVGKSYSRLSVYVVFMCGSHHIFFYITWGHTTVDFSDIAVGKALGRGLKGEELPIIYRTQVEETAEIRIR